MYIQELHESNIHKYQELTGIDRAEDISRYFFRGIACFDDPDEDSEDSLKAAMIWELKPEDDDTDITSEISWIYDTDSESLEAALDEYSQRALEEDVVKTCFELAGLKDNEEDVLSFSGFNMSPAESRDLKVSLKDFQMLTALRKKAPKYIQSIGSIDHEMFDQGLIKIMFNQNAGGLEDMYYLPKEWFDEKVSCCVMTDGLINGFLLVHRYPSGLLMPVFFYSAGADSRYNLLEMMRFAVHSASEEYPEDTPVLIRRRNESVRALTEKLFPGKQGKEVMKGERAEKE